MSIDMKTWQRLGLDPKRAAAYLGAARDRFPKEFPYDKWGAQDSARQSGIFYRLNLFILGAVGFSHAEDDLADWRERGAEIPPLGVEYFYGPWREGHEEFGEKLTSVRARQVLGWMEPYRRSLMAALCLDAHDDLAKLLEWPEPDLPDDEGTTDRTPGDKAFHILLARWLRGESIDQPDLRQTVSKGTRRRPKLLLATLDALMAGDVDQARAALAKFLQNYKKTEFRVDRVDFAISLDGTVLWHAARHRGIYLGPLAPDLSDLVVLSGEGEIE